MRKIIATIIILSILLLLNQAFSFFAGPSSFIVRALVVPVRGFVWNNTVKEPSKADFMRMARLEKEISRLEKENKTLRKQLGAIPEKSFLYPVTVLWETDTQYYASFSYKEKVDRNLLVGAPAVLNDIFMGYVERAQGQLLVIKKPTHAGFVAKGRTNKSVQGSLKGQFNEEAILEVDQEAKIKKGDAVYYVNTNRGWQLLVGKVSVITKNERLPIQQAHIEYLPGEYSGVETLFIAL